MKEDLRLLSELFAEAMAFLDETYQSNVPLFSNPQRMDIFIETRRADFINSIFHCFNSEGKMEVFPEKLKEEVQSFKDRTNEGLKKMKEKIR